MMKILIHLSFFLFMIFSCFATEEYRADPLRRVPSLNWSTLADLYPARVEDRTVVPPRYRKKFTGYNNLLDTNWEYDEALAKLSLPCEFIVYIDDYFEILHGSNKRAATNSYTSIGLQRDNTKVVIKTSMDAEGDNQFQLISAMTNALASKLGRAYFERPTIPPCILEFEESGSYTLISYSMEGEIDLDKDFEGQNLVYRSLHIYPKHFNREEYFTTKLQLFDDFFCFQDRSRPKQFFYPFTNVRNSRQVCAFYTSHYNFQHYLFNHGVIRLGLKKDRFPSLDLLISQNFQQRIAVIMQELLASDNENTLFVNSVCRTANQIPLDLFLVFGYVLRNTQIWGKSRELFKDLQSMYDPDDAVRECAGFLTVFRKYLSAEPKLDIETLCRKLRVINMSGLRLDLALLYYKNLLGTFQDETYLMLKRLDDAIDPTEPDAIINRLEQKLFVSEFDAPWAPLSAIVRLEDLACQYSKLVNDLKQPGYAEALKNHHLFWYDDGVKRIASPSGDIFGARYLYVMAAWHQHFLKHYQGLTFDDKDRCWQIYVGSNHLTNRLIINMIRENWPYPVNFTGWRK